MSRPRPLVRRTGSFVVLALAGALAACADSPTLPKPSSQRAPATAVRDDPPDTPCFTGWVVVNGIWTCGG